MGGSFAVSFLGSGFSGAGAMPGEVPAGVGAELDGGLGGSGGLGAAGGGVEGGLIPAAGGVLGGLGSEPGEDGGFGGPPAEGGTLGGFGGLGGVLGGLGRLPADGGALGGFGALGGATGFGGRFNITVSRGLEAMGLLSFRGGRTMRTVSFFGSAMVGKE